MFLLVLLSKSKFFTRATLVSFMRSWIIEPNRFIEEILQNQENNCQCRAKRSIKFCQFVSPIITARYSEKEIIAERYIPSKAEESAVACVLTRKSKIQSRVQENTKERHVTFIKYHASSCTKIRSRQIESVKGLNSCPLRHMNIYQYFDTWLQDCS